uniref:protein AMBP-like n=1 Tax=Centroberyx gerrardi TaxID=166262 RepID=UPI003AABBB42
METEVIVVPLLVLGWVWTLQGVPVLPEPLYPTQENFDLGRFLGKWYEVAVVSTCPHYMQRQRGDPAIVALELQDTISEGKVKMTATALRHGSCKQTSTDYGLTNTPGRFFYHVARFGADVDSYVVHTSYDEYATVIMLSTGKSPGDNSTIVKLYSRTMDVRAAALDDFKTLVRQQGMSNDTIIIKQNKGECVPGEQLTEPTAQPQRSKSSVMLSQPPEEVTSFTGPGFLSGKQQRV